MKRIEFSSESEDLIYKKSFESFGSEKVLFLNEKKQLYSLARGFFDYSENSGVEPCIIVFSFRNQIKEIGWLKKLVDDGFNLKNILIVGLTESFSGIKQFGILNLMLDLENKTDSIMEFGYGKNIFLVADSSIIDSDFGLLPRELIYILKRMNLVKGFKGMSLVGFEDNFILKFLGILR